MRSYVSMLDGKKKNIRYMMIIVQSLFTICIGYDVAPCDGIKSEEIIYFEDFENGQNEKLPSGWWVEGGERVWIKEGHLWVKANPSGEKNKGNVCTVWLNKSFAGNLKLEFDARVVNSTIDANNINIFFLYSDPDGIPLYDSRNDRSHANYKLYHNLNGYIFTFLNDRLQKTGVELARMRIRKCPGFKLIAETYGYHCLRDVTYHVTIKKLNDKLEFSVDGRVYLDVVDEGDINHGIIGLRTYQTELWWDNIKITKLR
jgi:hypothetical protein